MFRTLVVLSVLLAAPVSLPSEAGAVVVPDSTRLMEWRTALAGSGRLRVRTPAGTRVLSGARLTETGVLGLDSPTGQLTHTFTPLEPTQVAWQNVMGVDRLQPDVGRGVRWGLAVGLVAGVLVARQVERDGALREPGAPPAAVQRAAVMIIIPLTFGFFGGVAGAVTPTWHRAIP